MTDAKTATAEAIDTLANLLEMPWLKSLNFTFSVDADNVPIVRYTVEQYVGAQGGVKGDNKNE